MLLVNYELRMMLEKIKRKVHPYNSKQYWIIFSLLALVLLIPFRIVGFWILTNIIYISISIVIGIVLLRFIRRYSWKHWIVALMLVCVMIACTQMFLNSQTNHNCTVVQSDVLFKSISCSTYYLYGYCKASYVLIGNTSIGFRIQPFQQCTWWGLSLF